MCFWVLGLINKYRFFVGGYDWLDFIMFVVGSCLVFYIVVIIIKSWMFRLIFGFLVTWCDLVRFWLDVGDLYSYDR